MNKKRLPPHGHERIAAILRPVDAALSAHFPGDSGARQPIHTAYVSAAQADAHTLAEWGAEARSILAGQRVPLGDMEPAEVIDAVDTTLAASPVQDLRIDFEDGYGWRADAVEDVDARRAGNTLRELSQHPGLLVNGVRTKGLTASERKRAIRTLELVLEAADGPPPGFVFTIPKLRMLEQVRASVALCEELELVHGLPSGSLRFELQIESPQAIISADGGITVAKAIHRAQGRCAGLHFGTYDYTASCGIASQYQALDHPAADFAKAVMQVAAAQTGVWIADGSTQFLPLGDEAQVIAALRRHHALVHRALVRGFYQGWDMHPGHLVTRWLATYGFFRSALHAAAPRLQSYLEQRASLSVVGDVADEPATAQALADVVTRGLQCGAFTPEHVLEQAPHCTVAALNQLRTRTSPKEHA